MARRIETHFIPGPTGRLEALLEEPEHGEPVEAALVCHPHPQHGGTMHNKVVHRTARGLRKSGAVVLRFNYRGVNLSEGSYDHGHGETEDARACLSWLLARYPHLPYTLAGFSFGSRIALTLGCAIGTASRIIALGFPTGYRHMEFLETCPLPKIFVQSTNDEHGPRDQLAARFPAWAEPKQLHWVEAEDHFFKGALDRLEETIAGLLVPRVP